MLYLSEDFNTMKEITLKIPDQKLDFFMELVKQLGLEISEASTIVVHEWQKEEVLNRIKNTPTEAYIPWKEAKEQLHHKTV